MEFERRSKKGKAKAREEETGDLRESLRAQSDLEAIREGLMARREAEMEQDAASTSTSTESVTQETLHNIDIAQGLLSSGGVSGEAKESTQLTELTDNHLGRLMKLPMFY